jgi:hypothetical protein
VNENRYIEFLRKCEIRLERRIIWCETVELHGDFADAAKTARFELLPSTSGAG